MTLWTACGPWGRIWLCLHMHTFQRMPPLRKESTNKQAHREGRRSLHELESWKYVNVLVASPLRCEMRITMKKLSLLCFALCCLFTCYAAYILFSRSSWTKSSTHRDENQKYQGEPKKDWNPWGEDFDLIKNKTSARKRPIRWESGKPMDFYKKFANVSDHGYHSVEIWGKAAIGLYLWKDIFGGKIEPKMDGIWSYGFLKEENIKFKFRTGPGLIPSKVPQDIENLVLVLVNGRAPEKREYARLWLDLIERKLVKLKNLAVVLLGSEQCQNDWIKPYLSQNGGLVQQLFLVYDSPEVNDVNIHQWPLGTATYRGFQHPKVDYLLVNQPRNYVCNFLGTLYKKDDSSRNQLVQVIKNHGLESDCYMKPRHKWEPEETEESRNLYTSILSQSDLTLCPVGINTECYRIYEALAYGSLPVVEDVMTPGLCGGVNKTPLHLLKAMNAPFIYVKSWDELPGIISREKQLSHEEIVMRRRDILDWYDRFRVTIKSKFVKVLQKNFFF